MGLRSLSHYDHRQGCCHSTCPSCHDAPSAGHPGRDRTLAAARSKYYWPTMLIDIEKHVSRCFSCVKMKGTTTTDPILEYSLPQGPFVVVALDLL